MQKYILTREQLEFLLRNKINFQWKKNYENFTEYLIENYPPDHELIQSFCETDEERKNPLKTGIYKEIRVVDVAKYELKLYKQYKE